MRPLWVDITIIIVGIILFFTMTWIIAHYIVEYLIEQEIRIRRRRRIGNRIVPIDRLVRLAQFRRQMVNGQRYLSEIEQHNKVMAELKNKVIVVNPDNNILLGIEN